MAQVEEPMLASASHVFITESVVVSVLKIFVVWTVSQGKMLRRRSYSMQCYHFQVNFLRNRLHVGKLPRF